MVIDAGRRLARSGDVAVPHDFFITAFFMLTVLVLKGKRFSSGLACVCNGLFSEPSMTLI
jgi:hypothetical protein